MQKPSQTLNKALFPTLLLATFWVVPSVCASNRLAQAPNDASPQQTIQSAVDSELRANREDKSVWKYTDEDDAPGRAATYDAIETPQGELRRLIKLNGHPLDSDAEQKETSRIRHYIHDASAQARARKDGEHDDKQAVALLKMLPTAFQWTITSRTPEIITLHFAPNPSFDPPTMEARVLAAMEGQIVVSVDGDRIRSLRGRLTHEVKFGYGFLGKMYQGGTFNVERRQVGGGHWEITETHVHIGGRALLFKNIDQNSDEVKTGWSPSTAETLADAARQLGVQP
jgi:hypothetical protein